MTTTSQESGGREGRRAFPAVQAVFALTAALLGLAWWMPLRSSPLTVNYTRGGAVLESADGSQVEIVPGTVVMPGQKVVVPEGAAVNLTSPDGHAVSVADSTLLEVTESKGALLGGKVRTRLDVRRGNVRITGEGKARTSLDIGLPYGTAGVRGTEFTARVGLGLDLVSVHQGAVGVATASGESLDLAPGQGVVVSGDGMAVRDLPAAPQILAPEPGTEVGDETTVISWTAVEGAVGYVVEFAQDQAFQQIVARATAPSPSLVVPTLEEDLSAQIRVFAVTAEGLEGQPSAGRPLEIRIRRARGLAFLGRGDATSSIPEFQAAVPNFGDDAQLLRDLGWALYLESRYQEARETYERVLELQPNDSDATLELGRVYFWLGEYDLAEGSYQRVLERFPDDADALWGLGDTYRMTGRTQEAVDLVERALRIQPGHPYAGETLRRLRNGG